MCTQNMYEITLKENFMNESYSITLEEIENLIVDLESQIDFENKFNKLVSSESFNEVFYNVIFGTELLALTVRLADDKSDEAELETIEEIKRVKFVKKYLEDRKDKLMILKDRLSSAKEMRTVILKNNNQ